jgi:hypothetical protein
MVSNLPHQMQLKLQVRNGAPAFKARFKKSYGIQTEGLEIVLDWVIDVGLCF